MTVQPHSEGGSIVTIRAQPNAKKPNVSRHADGLKVAVAAPLEDGRANAAIGELLATRLGVRRSEVEIVAGHTSRQKTIRVSSMTPEALMAKVAELLPGA